MTFDPAWDMPKVNWQQQGSFEQGELALVDHPSDAPLICIPPINRHWLPYILGCLDQLTNPSSWIVSSDAAMNAILDKAIELKQLVGSAGDCMSCPLIRLQDCVLQSSCDGGATWVDVDGWADNFGPCVQSAAIITTPPPNPSGRTTDQMACSIAGYLTDQVITVAIQQAVDNFNNNRNLLQLGVDLALIIPEFQLVGLFVTAVSELYSFYSSITISYFESALTDPTLFSDIRCAVYNAIAADGHLTLANFTTVLSNVCGISYVHSDVIDAICAFLTSAGFAYVNQLSQGAGLNPYDDCSDCGASPTWCYHWDFTSSDGGWAIYPTYDGSYAAGIGWQSGTALRGYSELGLWLAFAATQYITRFRVEIFFPAASGGGLRIFFVQNPNGTSIATQTISSSSCPGGCGYDYNPVNLTLTAAGILIRSVGSTAPMIVTEIDLNGTGINPFGPNNCT